MYYPDKGTFQKIAQRGNLIPVYREICADMDTPVSAFKKIDSGKSFLLESVDGGEKIARYSFLGSDPMVVILGRKGQVEIQEKSHPSTVISTENPLKVLKEQMARFRTAPVAGLPRFFGGAVGYIGYDHVRSFEPIPEENPDELNVPEFLFFITDTLLIFDHMAHTIKIISNAFIEDSVDRAYEQAIEKINQLYKKLQSPAAATFQILDGDVMNRTHPSTDTVLGQLNISSNYTQADFEQCVKTAKEYIAAGDIFQVVLSQRLSTGISCNSFDLYRALRLLNPSPYMYYLQHEDFRIVGASPELLVRVEDGVVEERPIAGTRKRGTTEEEDRFLAENLLADPKERAEHIMLVDLGRNDMGRVCRPGTVHVTELMVIERYSHVMHIVSNVKGILRDDKDCYDALTACFPAGTVSGAPKVRAMQIIEELEPVKRGPYAGAVGYFGFSGNMDTCITIRTIVIKGSTAYIQAGAGIVADSDPQLEYQETLNKARALIEAIRKVNSDSSECSHDR
ncbi:MAG: anthranilate synthase component I [bacterium]